MNVAIERDFPVPLYHQLAKQLKAAISDGRLQPGAAFENELALTGRLGLSRPTVRRAIQEMVDQGLLVRQRGLGTRVANRKVHRRAELTSLFDDLRRQGRRPSTTICAMRSSPTSGQPLHWTSSRTPPCSSSSGSVPPTRAPSRSCTTGSPLYSDIPREELEEGGRYAALRARGVRPVVAQQTIGARMPTPAERQNLGLRVKQPVLTMTRMAFDASGKAVEFGDHCYRAEDYSIDIMVDER